MSNEEIIKTLEEAKGFINKFYSKTGSQVVDSIVGGVNVDTEDITEADNRIDKVIDKLKKS